MEKETLFLQKTCKNSLWTRVDANVFDTGTVGICLENNERQQVVQNKVSSCHVYSMTHESLINHSYLKRLKMCTFHFCLFTFCNVLKD